MTVHVRLCVIYRDERVLLGMKKRGFGAGKWNGFGGKVQEGETILAAAMRECQEEAAIVPKDIEPRGALYFSFENGTPDINVSLFAATSFSGTPSETDEMRPKWFAISDIPYQSMWADDVHWLPHVLAGKSVRGKFHFADQATLLRWNVTELSQRYAITV